MLPCFQGLYSVPGHAFLPSYDDVIIRGVLQFPNSRIPFQSLRKYNDIAKSTNPSKTSINGTHLIYNIVFMPLNEAPKRITKISQQIVQNNRNVCIYVAYVPHEISYSFLSLSTKQLLDGAASQETHFVFSPSFLSWVQRFARNICPTIFNMNLSLFHMYRRLVAYLSCAENMNIYHIDKESCRTYEGLS